MPSRLLCRSPSPPAHPVAPPVLLAQANEVRTFFPASSPVPQLASPDQMAARAIEVEARKAAFQLTTTPGLPASSRFEDFDQLPIDQRPVDARVGMLVELLDEAQVTLLSCGAGHLLDAQGKVRGTKPLYVGTERRQHTRAGHLPSRCSTALAEVVVVVLWGRSGGFRVRGAICDEGGGADL